jgi:hypothetical protein
MSTNSQQSGQTGEYRLRAVFFGNREKHFSIRIAPNEDVYEFMKLVKGENPRETAYVDAADLKIWKVDYYVPTMLHIANQPSQLTESIATSQRMEELPKCFHDLPKYCTRMDSEDIKYYFKEPPPPKHIHIIVQISAAAGTGKCSFLKPLRSLICRDMPLTSIVVGVKRKSSGELMIDDKDETMDPQLIFKRQKRALFPDIKPTYPLIKRRRLNLLESSETIFISDADEKDVSTVLLGLAINFPLAEPPCRPKLKSNFLLLVLDLQLSRREAKS